MFTDTYKTDLISAAFPKYLRKDVNIILEILSAKAVLHYCIVTDYGNDYTLDEDTVHIPYRIYWSDATDTEYEKLSQMQKQILSCIYTRSCEGHTREKHVRKLLDMPIEP
ncbi:MAG: hypothetical protein IKV40_01995, partial [Clostridia bacterium]|nr:hypothetical protein [Clostridia bacterium]